MCFSTAVIIILDTQAQTNPLSSALRERERERQNASLTAHMSLLRQRHHLKGKRMKEEMTCLEKVWERERKSTTGNITFHLKRCFIEQSQGFNHNKLVKLTMHQRGYLLGKRVSANIIWRMNEPWNPTSKQSEALGPEYNSKDDCSILKNIGLSMHYLHKDILSH